MQTEWDGEEVERIYHVIDPGATDTVETLKISSLIGLVTDNNEFVPVAQNNRVLANTLAGVAYLMFNETGDTYNYDITLEYLRRVLTVLELRLNGETLTFSGRTCTLDEYNAATAPSVTVSWES